MGMLRRQARIARIIKEVASRVILYELSDPRIGLVTITRVEPSRDNRYAKVYVSVLGDRAEINKTMAAVNSARAVVQAELAKNLSTRFTPVLTFIEDQSVKNSIRISQLIKKALGESKSAESQERGSEETHRADD